MTQEERHQLLTDIAEVLAGLQVPYSINKSILGEAGEGWLKVWQRLHIFGWQSKEDIRLLLVATLLDE